MYRKRIRPQPHRGGDRFGRLPYMTQNTVTEKAVSGFATMFGQNFAVVHQVVARADIIRGCIQRAEYSGGTQISP